MRRLIKSQTLGDQTRIRSVGAGGFQPLARQQTEADRERSMLLQAIDDLAAKAANQDKEVARLKAKAADAYNEGLVAGRELGRREADEGTDRRVERLSSGVQQALDIFRRELTSLERLAPLVARQALERVLDDPRHYADLLGATLEHHLRQVDAAALIRIDVSASDFPNDADLAALRRRIDGGAVELNASAQMAAGGCRVKMRLGALDVGLDQQWPRLRELLEDLSMPQVVS